MKWTLAVAALLLAATLAGCAEDEKRARELLETAQQGFGGVLGGRPTDLQFTMQVTAGKVVPGRCFDGYAGFGQECHVLNVTIDLRQENRTLDLWHDWSGITGDGVGHPNFAEGGTTAAGGMLVKTQLKFDLDAGTSLRVVEVRHKGNWGPTLTKAAVPAY